MTRQDAIQASISVSTSRSASIASESVGLGCSLLLLTLIRSSWPYNYKCSSVTLPLLVVFCLGRTCDPCSVAFAWAANDDVLLRLTGAST